MSVTIRVGHVVDVLRSMAADSVQCVVTSVPYWGLRSYKTTPQIFGGNERCDHFFKDAKGHKAPICMFCCAWLGEHGLEPTLEMWLAHEVLIWREMMRVLRKDGVAFLNCGDAYAGGGRGTDSNSTLQGSRQNQVESRVAVRSRTSSSMGLLRAKQRLMLPARLALALQADGWFLRDEIVWHKPNPMPSSVKDRTTPAHEMIYVLAKRPRYFWDADAIAEPCEWDPADTKMPDGWDTGAGAHGSVHRNGREKGARRNLAQFDIEDIDSQNGTRQIDGDARNGPEPYVGDPPIGRSGNKARVEASDRGAIRGNVAGSVPWEGTTRNKRSVWTIPTEPFGDAHFATFPTRLVEPMILAATSAKGACARCGAPWARVTYRRFQRQADVSKAKGVRGAGQQKPLDASDGRQGTPRGATISVTTGWEQTCKCTDAGVRPCIVMDPFLGSGTVGLVADRLGRDAIGIELNPDYAQMAKRRIRGDSSLLARVEVVAEAVPEAPQAVEFAHEDVARHGNNRKMASAAPDATAASSQNETRSDATE